MRDMGFAATTLILGSLFAFVTSLAAVPAEAASHHFHRTSVRKIHAVVHHVRHVREARAVYRRSVAFHRTHVASKHYAKFHSKYHAKIRHVIHVAGNNCVPFARADSGIKLPGNAWQWWGNAAGVYQRGRIPQPGAVLDFRSNPHMPLGHVAVVAKVINRREIEINQANWIHGEVSHDVPVVDVSEANDWTAVRVEVGHSGVFGSVYPTYGFIYDTPDTGTLLAAAHAPPPQPVLNPAPTDLRPAAEQPWTTYEEVAELPSGPRHYVRPHPVVAAHHVYQQEALEQR